MKLATKLLCTGAAAMGAVALCACDSDDHYHHRRAVVVHESEPVYTEPPVVYDYTYYDRGYYNGPYWVYRDRSGHEWREAREEHERRIRERGQANFREAHPPQGVERRARAEHDEHDHDRR
jgi:hypothetical protein